MCVCMYHTELAVPVPLAFIHTLAKLLQSYPLRIFPYYTGDISALLLEPWYTSHLGDLKRLTLYISQCRRCKWVINTYSCLVQAGTMLSTFHSLSPLMLTALWDKFYYQHHFTDKETVKHLSNLFKVTCNYQSPNCNPSLIWLQSEWCQNPLLYIVYSRNMMKLFCAHFLLKQKRQA